MYTTATIHAVIGVAFEDNAFADHGGSPTIVQAITEPPKWYTALGASMFLITLLLADCMIVSYFDLPYLMC